MTAYTLESLDTKMSIDGFRHIGGVSVATRGRFWQRFVLGKKVQLPNRQSVKVHLTRQTVSLHKDVENVLKWVLFSSFDED